MTPPTREQLDAVTRALGAEIRTARQERDWTRKQLLAQLGPVGEEVSSQTLATWELGTRRMTVTRLVELGAALDKPAEHLLRRATAAVFSPDYVDVDLSALAATSSPQLAALQRWAEVRVLQSPPGEPLIEKLDRHALVALARVAGCTPRHLAVALRDLQPQRD